MEETRRIFLDLVETGLNIKEMFEVLRLSGYDREVIKAVMERIDLSEDWSEIRQQLKVESVGSLAFVVLIVDKDLSVDQMLELFRISKYNKKVAKAIIRKLSFEKMFEEMFKLVEDIEEDDIEDVMEVLIDSISWKELSFEEKERILTIARNSGWRIFKRTSLAMIKRSDLSFGQMLEILRHNDGNQEVAEAIIETGKLSLEEMFKIIQVSKNNPNVADAVADTVAEKTTKIKDVPLEMLIKLFNLSQNRNLAEKIVEKIVERVTNDTNDKRLIMIEMVKTSGDAFVAELVVKTGMKTGILSVEEMFEILGFTNNSWQVGLAMIRGKRLTMPEILRVIKRTRYNPEVVRAAVEVGGFSEEEVFRIFKDSGASVVVGEIVIRTGISPEKMWEIFKMANNSEIVGRAMVETEKLSKEEMFRILELTGNSEEVGKAILKTGKQTGKLTPKEMLRVLKITHAIPLIAYL